MSNEFIINDYRLTQECQSIAADIIAEYEDEDERDDAVHQTVDGHQWVIYNHKALMLCAHCDVDKGEAFVDDTGFQWVQGDSTIFTVACLVAYGEMIHRVREEMAALLENAA
tara:strand:+ start:347 stop:682 length:336 start_codon:yes stop_codon:yes gene_type:complete